MPKLNKELDVVVVAVAHLVFRRMWVKDISKFINSHLVLIDEKGMVDWDETEKKGMFHWKL